MKEAAFRAWLASRYATNSAATHLSSARKVENAYGDLDNHHAADRFASLLRELAYSLTDSKSNRPNPTNIAINGNPYNVLNNCKSGIRCYADFIENGGEIETVNVAAVELAGEVIRDRREGRQFEVERNLQDSLRREITQLENGLIIIDGGDERAVESGFIDILAEDAAGALTVIEVKAGQAKRDAVGQILGYMGDLKTDEPDRAVRGILVAASFDKSCLSAVSVVSALKLKEYRFDFAFASPEDR